MNKRKSLSLDVMQQFMKDPSTIEQSSSTEVGTENITDISTEVNDDLLADVIAADVDDKNILAETSTETSDDLLTDMSTEINTDVSTEADRTEQSHNPRPQQQAKAKSHNPKPEKTKPKRGSTATKAEESSLSVDVIEAFKRTPKEATTRFTVDLPQSQHQEFAIVSKKLNTNMSTLARVLIEKFLTEIERDGLL
jgi:hypothetical protein